VLQCVAACYSVLQCVAECCRVSQCVAVCCSVLRMCIMCVWPGFVSDSCWTCHLYLYVWHDSFTWDMSLILMCATWLIHMHTHLCESHVLCVRHTLHIWDMRDMSLIRMCATWLIHMSHMWNSSRAQNMFCVYIYTYIYTYLSHTHQSHTIPMCNVCDT